jgi:hypothetical protein
VLECAFGDELGGVLGLDQFHVLLADCLAEDLLFDLLDEVELVALVVSLGEFVLVHDGLGGACKLRSRVPSNRVSNTFEDGDTGVAEFDGEECI